MSRQHAMISLQEVSPDHWSWVLEDLSSRNGVFVRCKEFSSAAGQRVFLGGTKLLMHGDPSLVGRCKRLDTSHPVSGQRADLESIRA